jgi:hypothetical protein
MITRYAYIDPDTQELLWGPGPMPYFITLKDGTMWEITAHTTEENEVQGIYIVDQVNYREFDPRFEAALIPEFSIVNGRPTETWSYEFITYAGINMLAGIDEYSEEMRSFVASSYAGQMAEYEEAYTEAVEVAAIPAEQEVPANLYTFLEADVGVTVSSSLNRPVANIREAAELVIQTRNVWKIFGANLRKARLLAKKQIKEATDAAPAKVIYDEFVSKKYYDYLPQQN